MESPDAESCYCERAAHKADSRLFTQTKLKTIRVINVVKLGEFSFI